MLYMAMYTLENHSNFYNVKKPEHIFSNDSFHSTKALTNLKPNVIGYLFSSLDMRDTPQPSPFAAE